MAASHPKGLTGVWEGMYSYPRSYRPTAFTAVMMDSTSAISGTIHERCNNGSLAGRRLNATLTGERKGRTVRFLKVYLSDSGEDLPPIAYEGTLSSDGEEIEGQWTIPGQWSGRFLMIRTSRRTELAGKATLEALASE